MFKNMETIKIVIDHEDADYIYFSIPPKTRVGKITEKVEKYTKKYGWETQKLFPSITNPKKPGYPGSMRFTRSINGKLTSFSAARVIATALIPNPEGYTFIRLKDGNSSNLITSNLEWCERQDMFASKRYRTLTSAEQKILDAIPGPHNRENKEYMYFINHLRDDNGMTKADRSRLRKTGKLEATIIKNVTSENCNIVKTAEEIHNAAMDLITSIPKYDPVTHIQKGFILPTPDMLEKIITESKCTAEVAEEARVVLRDIALKILNETTKNEQLVKAATKRG